MAEVFLGPGVVVIKAGADFFGVEREAVFDGVVDGEARFVIGGELLAAD